MLILVDNVAFLTLSRLLQDDYDFSELNVYVQDYVFFSKNNLPPIQVDSKKITYSDLDLSSYSIQAGEDDVETFINRFRWMMKTIEKYFKT